MTDLKEARRTGLEFATGNNPGVGTLILNMVAEIARLRKALEFVSAAARMNGLDDLANSIDATLSENRTQEGGKS